MFFKFLQNRFHKISNIQTLENSYFQGIFFRMALLIHFCFGVLYHLHCLFQCFLKYFPFFCQMDFLIFSFKQCYSQFLF